MILICKNAFPTRLTSREKNSMLTSQSYFILVHTVQKMLIENVIQMLKTKISYFLDRENIDEATWSKNSKYKIFTSFLMTPVIYTIFYVYNVPMSGNKHSLLIKKMNGKCCELHINT